MKKNITYLMFIVLLNLISVSIAAALSDADEAFIDSWFDEPEVVLSPDVLQDSALPFSYVALLDPAYPVDLSLPQEESAGLPATVAAACMIAEKRYSCSSCEKMFRSNSGLRRHMHSVHEGARHQCPLCDQSYTQKSHVNEHIKNIHRKEKHQCSLCDKTFTKKSNVAAHIKTIHEEIIYTCEMCKKDFRSKRNLQQHIKTIHVREKHQCPTCECSYTQKSNLNKHVKNIHEKITYQCPSCEKIYKDKSNLNTHKRNKHPETVISIKRQRTHNSDVCESNIDIGIGLSADGVAALPSFNEE